LPSATTRADAFGARFWGQVRGFSGLLRARLGERAASEATKRIAGKADDQAGTSDHTAPLRDDGRVATTKRATTLSEAEERASELRSKLRERNVHPDVLKFCRKELYAEKSTSTLCSRRRSASPTRSGVGQVTSPTAAPSWMKHSHSEGARQTSASTRCRAPRNKATSRLHDALERDVLHVPEHHGPCARSHLADRP